MRASVIRNIANDELVQAHRAKALRNGFVLLALGVLAGAAAAATGTPLTLSYPVVLFGVVIVWTALHFVRLERQSNA